MQRSIPLFLIGALALSACSESSAPACATQIAEDVCSTPAQLRGAEPVPTVATNEASVTLPPEPLAEGRYVLVARRHACPTGVEPSLPVSVQGVLEVSGCVLRRTLVSEPEPARVEVFELGYAGQGLLALQRRCPQAEAASMLAGYGSDAVQIELGQLRPADTVDAPAACDTLDTWELR